MKIGVTHDVTDPEGFAERGDAMIRDENLPTGVTPKQFCPSTDGTAATCVWEAESVEQLSDYIDATLGDVSTQTYFPIDEDTAFGLPP